MLCWCAGLLISPLVAAFDLALTSCSACLTGLGFVPRVSKKKNPIATTASPHLPPYTPTNHNGLKDRSSLIPPVSSSSSSVKLTMRCLARSPSSHATVSPTHSRQPQLHVPAAHTTTRNCCAAQRDGGEAASTSSPSSFGRREALSLITVSTVLAQTQDARAVQVRFGVRACVTAQRVSECVVVWLCGFVPCAHSSGLMHR